VLPLARLSGGISPYLWSPAHVLQMPHWMTPLRLLQPQQPPPRDARDSADGRPSRDRAPILWGLGLRALSRDRAAAMWGLGLRGLLRDSAAILELWCDLSNWAVT
jgi:hypothetical protein